MKSTEENRFLRARIEALELQIDQNISAADDDDEDDDADVSDINDNDDVSEEPNSTDTSISQLRNDLTDLREDFKITQAKCARNEFKLSPYNNIESSHSHSCVSFDILNARTEEIKDQVLSMQRDLIRIGQYTRRPNLIIDGIPNSVPQENLEATCVQIIRALGFPINSPFEIEGCHRLGFDADGFTPVIIRFVNRKVKEFCLANRHRLAELNSHSPWKLSLREDMEHSNVEIEKICADLLEKKIIKKYVARNGFTKFFIPGNSKPSKITHIMDLRDKFSDYFDEYYDYLAMEPLE